MSVDEALSGFNKAIELSMLALFIVVTILFGVGFIIHAVLCAFPRQVKQLGDGAKRVYSKVCSPWTRKKDKTRKKGKTP